MGAGEIGAQPFAGQKLVRLDQRPPVAAAPPRQPGQGTFPIVHRDAGWTLFGHDLALRQGEVPGAEFIDRRWPVGIGCLLGLGG
jgi:hypothetical protein